MKSGIDISIVIRTKNEEKYIEETLQKIFEQKIDLSFEVIVIDSGSTDSTLEIVKKYLIRLKEISPKDFTYTYALNLGIELAKGDLIVNLSAHAVPYNNFWLRNLVNPVIENNTKNVVASYGREIPHPNAILPERIRLRAFKPILMKTSRSYFYNEDDFKNSLNEIARLSNVNSCIRRDFLKKNPFKESLASEDRQIALDIIRNGFSIIYQPIAIVYHSHNDSVGDMALRWTRAYIAESSRKGESPKKYLGYYTIYAMRGDVMRMLREKGAPRLERYKWAWYMVLKWLRVWYLILCYYLGKKSWFN